MSTQSTPRDDRTLARLALLTHIAPEASAAELVSGRLLPGTREAIRVFQREQGLGVSGVVDDATADVLAARAGSPRSGHARRLRIAGQVRHADESAAAGLTVRAFDRDLRREQDLGEAGTDESGHFLIEYGPEQFARAEKRSADLLLRVFDGDRLVHESALDRILFNAPDVAVVVIDLDDAGTTVESEYEMIFRTIVPLLDDVPLDGLRETADVRDVTFLAAETGIAAYRVAWFGLAQKVASIRQLPTAFFYALFVTDALLRTGGASGLRTYVDVNSEPEPLYWDIVLLPEKTVRRAVSTAVRELAVPRSVEDHLDRILARLAVDAQEARTYAERHRSASIIAAVTPLLTGGGLARIADLTDENMLGDLDGLMDRLHGIVASIEVPDPDTTALSGGLALAGVLGFDGPVIARVRDQHGVTGDGDLRKLARLSRADWTRTLSDHPLADLHAAAITDRMEARFPTAALAANLGRDAGAFDGHRDALVRFFDTHTDLDFSAANIDVLLRDRPVEGMGRAASTLKAMQRVFRLAPTYPQTKALLDAGITSAAQIHAMSRTRFLDIAGASGTFTPQQARVAFGKAVHVHIAATFLAGQMQALPAATTIAGVSAPLAPGTLAKIGADFPTFKTLFGTGDVCACDECRSVHSAAAYLVDTLQFLKHRAVVDTTGPGGDQHIAKDVLIVRRPDLGDTDLNCANTNTSLPYLDIVCELLEEAIAPDPGFTYTGTLAVDTDAAGHRIGPADPALVTALRDNGLTFTDRAIVFPPDRTGHQVVRDTAVVAKLTPSGGDWVIREMRQTYGTDAELAAAPKYVNQNAYTILANSPIAFGLPFDLAHAEAGSYLTQAGIARADLMRALRVGGVPSDAAIAAEAWGLTDAERLLVVTADAGAQQTIWHTPGAAPVTLTHVDTFTARTGIAYPDLLEMLTLRWLNPGGALTIKHTAAGCDLATKTIDGLDDDALDRFHRFIRLWRATGWSLSTVDRVIRARGLGNEKLDDACLVATRALRDVADRLTLDIDDACDLFDTLPSDGDGSRYARVYLNKSALGTVPDALRPADVVALGGTVPVSTYRSSIALSLGITETETDALIATLPSPAFLTLDNLSRLYATRRLAGATRRSIADLLILLDLTGFVPPATPTDALGFLDELTAIGATGTSAVDLRYTLRHEADDLTVRELPDVTITAALTRTQTAIRAARTADVWTVAATDELDDQRAALIASLTKIPGRTTADIASVMSIVDGTWADPTVTATAFLSATLSDSTDAAALAGILGAVTVAPTDPQRIALIQLIGTAVGDSRYAVDKRTAVVTELTTTLSSTVPMVTAVLAGVLATTGLPLLDVLSDDVLAGPAGTPAPTVTSTGFDDQYRAVRLAREMLAQAASLGLEPAYVTWLLATSTALGGLALDALPYQTGVAPIAYIEWRRLVDGVALAAAHPPVVNATAPDHPYTTTGLFDLVVATAPIADVVAYASAVFGWDPILADAVATQLGTATADVADPVVLSALDIAVAAVRTLGVSLPQAVALTATALTATDAATLRRALRTRYADSDWLGVLRDIQDRLRERKRDALVAYLLAVNPQLSTADDLFDNFLIDVEMSACMPTSRIVQAHATVQLFVQRCLMGLEPTCVADVRADSGWAQWKWMAQFRVWEANRKVFLWPENWLIPDVRDDKSEQFLALENKLRQDVLTDVAVEDATAAYLEGLDDIAHLEVMATYYQTATGIMHVFARTRDGDGRTYLYRQFIKERAWTPWTTVPLDITGNHLTAFERNGRLALAWPQFTVDANTDMELTLSDPLPAGPTPTPERRLNIQICVSELANGRWRAKKVSQNPVTYPPDQPYTSDPLPDVNTLNFFVIDLGTTGQSIMCVAENGSTLGGFALTGCKGYPEPLPWTGGSGYQLYPRYRDTALVTEKHVLGIDDSGSDLTERDLAIGGDVTILGKTPKPGRFEITHPMQFTYNDLLIYLVRLLIGGTAPEYQQLRGEGRSLPLGTLMPFFYGDYDRGYVIVPGLYPRVAQDREDGPWAGSKTTVGDRTYSDLNQFVRDATALARTYLAIYVVDKDLPALITKLVADAEYVRLAAYVGDLLLRRYGMRFENFYHPLVCSLRIALDSGGVDGLMRRDIQLRQTAFDFDKTFAPTPVVMTPYPVEDIDFSSSGAYSGYNWELFFHLPYEMAYRLGNDQQFEAARDWLHYIFNPVGVIEPGNGPAPQAPAKYWITKPFFQRTPADYATELIDAISQKMALDPAALHIDDLVFAVDQWREHPFSPFVVARSRTVAFQIATVKAYVRNLIDWADSEFRKFTRESVTAATQLYLMATKLLGPKPQVVPPENEAPTETYNQLEASLDIFGNALVDVENLIPGWAPQPESTDPWMPAPISATSLYFCIPPNEEMLAMWDVVADRLFKIRHCMNIDGVESMLALFAPPIDPGALIRALAGGQDISSVLAGLGAPPPYYRFSVMSQKATELAQHVSALGTELLSALEKRDSEKLGQIRASQEQAVLAAVREIKTAALVEARGAVTAFTKSKAITQVRRDHYASRQFMNDAESTAADIYEGIVIGQSLLGVGYLLAGVMSGIPDFMIGMAGFGGSPAANVNTGGRQIAGATELGVKAQASLLKALEMTAAMTTTQGAYRRRADDWDLQVRTADKELVHIDQQITNADLRIAMLDKDLAAHDKSIANAKATYEYLTGKYTNADLYEWTVGQISSIYFEAYKLAFDTAKKAERCFEHELGSDAGFVNGPYWDSLKKGLQAAPALLHDIKRMEVAYLDRNRREFELTKHVSLAQLDPAALLSLRTNGSCDFLVPELAFDLDYPGHYFRRLKTVGMSLPCVVGPYTTVNATLSLVSNRYRSRTSLPSSGTPAAKYAENPTGDDRFVYNVGTIQSIATSSGVNDNGLFEMTFHDDRYLPFEGCGAISRWHLELPKDVRQFDYASISDVLLHLRYTARGDGSLRKAASDAIVGLVNDFAHAVGTNGLFQALSLRDQFPDAWWQLEQTKATSLAIGAAHLPYWVRDRKPTIESVSWYASIAGKPTAPSLTVGGVGVPLNPAPNLAGVYLGTSTGVALGTPVTLATAIDNVDDIVVVVKYKVT